MSDDSRLIVKRDRAQERSVFSLEMARDGVRLRLQSASLGDRVRIRDLSLLAPHVRYPFDYTAGPKALQNHLTRLEEATVDVSFDALLGRGRSLPGDVRLLGVRPGTAGLTLWGEVEGVAFTIRASIGPAWAGSGGDVAVRLYDPRVFGRVSMPWDRLAATLAAAVPTDLVAAAAGDAVCLKVLRPVLAPLMAGMGFKLPLPGVGLEAARAGERGIALVFRADAEPGALPEASDAAPSDGEEAARVALDRLLAGERGTEAWEAFLRAGLATPRLWPEVLARARALADERPERLLPHLALALVAGSAPALIPEADRAAGLRRLMSAAEAAGDGPDLVHAAGFAAAECETLDPATALGVLGAARAAGVEDPPVLEATALALDRLGRADEARAVRARALALVTAGRTAEAVRRIVGGLERAGLVGVARTWLEETASACAAGRFGSEGPAMRRQAELVLAARDGVDAGGADRARERLRALLAADPTDRDALDLLRALASGPRETAEVVAALRTAADAEAGEARARFLEDASALTADRLGLRRQAVELLEAALSAFPRSATAADALDGLYEGLGLTAKRLGLARARLGWPGDRDERARLLGRVAALAEAVGDLPRAAEALAELLASDPSDRNALRASRRVLGLLGRRDELARVLGALADLEDDPAEHVRLQGELEALAPPALAATFPGAFAAPVPAGEAAAPSALDELEASSDRSREALAAGRAALAAGDAAAARGHAEACLGEDPDDVEALALARDAALADGDLERAAAHCARWADRRFGAADRMEALLELADLRAVTSAGLAGAAAALAEAVAGQPGDPRPLDAALRLSGSTPEGIAVVALPVARALAGAAVTDPSAAPRGADRLYEAGSFAWDVAGSPDDAVSLLELALALDPEHPAAREDLAVLYEATGRGEAALALRARPR